MGTVEAEIVITRDRSSGRVHRRYRLAGSAELVAHEGCNLDDAGEFDVLDSTDGVEPADLCERDFPASDGAMGAH